VPATILWDQWCTIRTAAQLGKNDRIVAFSDVHMDELAVMLLGAPNGLSRGRRTAVE